MIAGDYLFVGKQVGTVLSTSSYGNSGTSTAATSFALVDSGALNCTGFIPVRAQVGQTFIPIITSATTVTSSVWRIALANYTVLQ